MSELYQLPDGWEWKKLVDIVRFGCEKGFKPKIINGMVPFIGMADIDESKGRETNYILEKYENVSSGKTKFQHKAILVGKITPCTQNNKVSIVPDEIQGGFATTEVFALHCFDKLHPLFLNYYIRCKKINNYLISTMIGATGRQRVPADILKNLDIPIPPLEEQQRIVQKLDAIFERIDKAITILQKNIYAADNFMNSVLNDVFSNLEQNHEKDKIGNILDVLTDYHSNGAYKTLKANVELLDHEDYAIMVRATDLENNDFSKNIKYITKEAYNFMSKSKIFGGEVIVPKIGTIGNVYLMPYLNRPASLAMNTFLLRCSDRVINKFLFLYLRSSKGYEAILSRANGAVTKTITKDAIKSIELPLPSRLIQGKIVLFFDELSAKVGQLRSTQQHKMQNMLDLKSSILDQAFHGKL